MGGVLSVLLDGIGAAMSGLGFRPRLNASVFFGAVPFCYGLLVVLVVLSLRAFYRFTGISLSDADEDSENDGETSASEEASTQGGDDSHWMTDAERDEFFPRIALGRLGSVELDAIPIRAVYEPKRRDMDINVIEPVNALVIDESGAHGFIGHTLQLLGRSKQGGSVLCLDAGGYLFGVHSKLLSDRGYECRLLDFTEPSCETCLSPLDMIYDSYISYISAGRQIYEHSDTIGDYPNLKLFDDEGSYKTPWYEYEKEAYSDKEDLIERVLSEREERLEGCRELIDTLAEVLDLPENCRVLFEAELFALLEDSQVPELEMARCKFSFFNISKLLEDSLKNIDVLKDCFKGRSTSSEAAKLADKLPWGDEEEMLSVIDELIQCISELKGVLSDRYEGGAFAANMRDKPRAIFLKVPPESAFGYKLAAFFIATAYRELSDTGGRNIFFLLDGFYALPRLSGFDVMMEEGRLSSIWFEFAIRAFSDLEAVYGRECADAIEDECELTAFFSSKDSATLSHISDMCGSGEPSPLISAEYLASLKDTKGAESAVILSPGGFPLMSQFTNVEKCPPYETGRAALSGEGKREDGGRLLSDAYYDIMERNYLVLGIRYLEDR